MSPTQPIADDNADDHGYNYANFDCDHYRNDHIDTNADTNPDTNSDSDRDSNNDSNGHGNKYSNITDCP